MDAITLALAKQYTNKKVNNIVYDSKETLTISGKEQVPAPFTELIGLEVVDKLPGRRLLTATPERFSVEGNSPLYAESQSSGFTDIISYGTYNGMLDKVCLVISFERFWSNCPTYFYDKDLVLLLYAFEETHDTMGLGLTVPPGWYVVDGATYAVTPFDPEQHPFFMTTAMLDTNVQNDASDYLYSLFPLAEEIAYTVSESNIWVWEVADVSLSAICPVNVNHVEITGDRGLYTAAGMHYLASFSVKDGYIATGYATNIISNGEKTVTITYPVIKQLDPKFIPDGTPNIKKASIGDTVIVKAVDENGVPTAWESAIIHEKTLTAAKEYTDRQRLAHTEIKTITWDRETDGREVVMLEENAENNVYFRMVKVSDTPVELTYDSVKHMEMTYVRFKGTQNELTAQSSVDLNEVSIVRNGGMDIVTMNATAGPFGAISLTQDYTEPDDEGNEYVVFSRGVWFMEYFAGDLTYYITSLTVEEVHRIEPKYIPAGGGFPVVTLTTFPVLTDSVTLTDEECTQLDAACATGLPFVLRILMYDGELFLSGVPFVSGEPMTQSYACVLPMSPEPDEVGNIFHQYILLGNTASDDRSWTMTMGAMRHPATG